MSAGRAFARCLLFSLAAAGALSCGKPSGTGSGGSPPASPTASPPKFRAPRRIKDVSPVYPKSLEGSGRGGNVVLELTIGITGQVTGVEVKESLGPEFDAAAVAAARQWVYTPTLFKGEPALMHLTVTVSFAPPSPSAR